MQNLRSPVAWAVHIEADKVGNHKGNLAAPWHLRVAERLGRSRETAVLQRLGIAQGVGTDVVEEIVQDAGKDALRRKKLVVHRRVDKTVGVVCPGDMYGVVAAERDIPTGAGDDVGVVPCRASVEMATIAWLLWEVEGAQMMVLFAKAWLCDMPADCPRPKPPKLMAKIA